MKGTGAPPQLWGGFLPLVPSPKGNRAFKLPQRYRWQCPNALCTPVPVTGLGLRRVGICPGLSGYRSHTGTAHPCAHGMAGLSPASPNRSTARAI